MIKKIEYNGMEPPVRGLGDVIHKVALPVARVLKLPCVDPATKELRPDSPCAKRQAALNKILPL